MVIWAAVTATHHHSHSHYRNGSVSACYWLTVQAAGECLAESFGNTSFVNAIAEADKQKGKLKTILQEFLRVQENFAQVAAVDSSGSADSSEAAKPFAAAFERMENICKGLLALLCVEPSYQAIHCTNLRGYKGDDLTLLSIKESLTTLPFWMKLYDDFVTKGVQTSKLHPTLVQVSKSLDVGDTAAISDKSLREAVEQIPSMKKMMRSGATSEVEKLLYQALLGEAKAIIAGERPTLSMSRLDIVISGLGMYRDASGTLQTLQKLDAFKAKAGFWMWFGVVIWKSHGN